MKKRGENALPSKSSQRCSVLLQSAMESGLCLHVAESASCYSMSSTPLMLHSAAASQLFMAPMCVFCFIVLLLQLSWFAFHLLHSFSLFSLSLSRCLSVLLLGDRLLLVPLVVFSQFFSPFLLYLRVSLLLFVFLFSSLLLHHHCPIFSDNSGLSPLSCAPTTCISSATFSFSPSLLRLFLRPQDVRRCPVGPEVKPRLSTSHPTRHFDSSISSLCVVCVVLSVSRPA